MGPKIIGKILKLLHDAMMPSLAHAMHGTGAKLSLK